MKSKLKIYGIYMVAYLLLLPTLVTLGAVACINHLGDDGYFTETTIANIAGVGVAAASIFFASYIVWANKNIKLIPSFTSPLNYGPCAVMSAALIFISAHLALRSGIINGNIDWLTLVTGGLAFLSVLYFLISAISVKRRSIMRSDLGIIVLVFLCAYVAYIFFDTGTPINAPIKTTTMMAFLFFALFFLYETRLSLGREKWNYYVAFAFISSLISAYASIPNLIIYIIEGKVIGISIYETIIVFAFFVFSTFKLFLVGELVPERGSKIVNDLIESATARINELTPEEPEIDESEAIDENQFSILDEDESIVENETTETEEADENTIDIITESTICGDEVQNPAETSEIPLDDGTRVTENEPPESENKESEPLTLAENEQAATEADKAEEVESTPTEAQDENSSTEGTRVTFPDKKDSIEE